jgi:AraC-like DNA-binding protein
MTALVKSDAWGALGVTAGDGTAAELLHTVEAGSAILRHAFYKNEATVVRRPLENPAIIYTVGGPAGVNSSRQKGALRRLVYLPRGYEEVLPVDGTSHVLAIEIRCPDSSCPDFRWPSGPLPLSAPLHEQVWEVMLTIAERHPGAFVHASLNEFILNVGRYAEKPAPDWLRKLVVHLHENWKGPCSVGRLARIFGKSAPHICRSFKAYTGVTLQQYSMLLRLDQARGLIWSTAMPLAEVAGATGFADQSHLTRALSSHLKRTPRGLRRAAPCLQREEFIVDTSFG